MRDGLERAWPEAAVILLESHLGGGLEFAWQRQPADARLLGMLGQSGRDREQPPRIDLDVVVGKRNDFPGGRLEPAVARGRDARARLAYDANAG